MNFPRIFQPLPLAENTDIPLDSRALHYVAHVLRAKTNDGLIIFNGQGGEYTANIIHIDKKNVTVRLKNFVARECESPLELFLVQGISRGEKMDFTIQKAVELGVKKIMPIFTERCNVKLDDERQAKRLQHWQSIVISACEQCGRNRLPAITPPASLDYWLQVAQPGIRFALSPSSTRTLKDIKIPATTQVVLLIGPEGGLSDAEIKKLMAHQFLPLNLGPRILRTETAALAAITALQVISGDLLES